MVDREAALGQLTWALHLILAGKTASVNSRQEWMISSCEDERLASPGPCPMEDYPLYILRIHAAPYAYRSTHIYTDSKAGYLQEKKGNKCWGIKGC